MVTAEPMATSQRAAKRSSLRPFQSGSSSERAAATVITAMRCCLAIGPGEVGRQARRRGRVRGHRRSASRRPPPPSRAPACRCRSRAPARDQDIGDAVRELVPERGRRACPCRPRPPPCRRRGCRAAASWQNSGGRDQEEARAQPHPSLAGEPEAGAGERRRPPCSPCEIWLGVIAGRGQPCARSARGPAGTAGWRAGGGLLVVCHGACSSAAPERSNCRAAA